MPLFVLPLIVEVARYMDRPLQWPHRWGLSHIIKDCESATSVLQSSTWCASLCACSSHTDVHDMPARLASLTQSLLCMSVDFVSCTQSDSAAWNLLVSCIICSKQHCHCCWPCSCTILLGSILTLYSFVCLFFFVYKNSALRQGYINSTAKTSMYPLNYKILQ